MSAIDARDLAVDPQVGVDTFARSHAPRFHPSIVDLMAKVYRRPRIKIAMSGREAGVTDEKIAIDFVARTRSAISWVVGSAAAASIE